MIRRVVSCLALAALAACQTPEVGRDAGPALLTALDSQGDGYIGTTRTGQRFQIVSTMVAENRLCRVTTIEGASRYDIESFCKAPGGSWR